MQTAHFGWEKPGAGRTGAPVACPKSGMSGVSWLQKWGEQSGFSAAGAGGSGDGF